MKRLIMSLSCLAMVAVGCWSVLQEPLLAQNLTFTVRRLIGVVDARTIASNGGGTPATLTLLPTSSYVALTCNDPDGCTITMAETGITDGYVLTIVNVTANASEFTDTAGVSELTGTASLGEYQTLSLIYRTDRWVEVSRSADASTLPAPGSDTQVVFNDGGFLGGDAGLTYDKTTDRLTTAALTVNTGAALFVALENSVDFLAQRANGTSVVPTSTLTGESLMTWNMGGYITGTGYRQGASIVAIQNGAVGTFVPTDVVLTTFEAAGSWQWTFGTDGVLTTDGAIKAPVFVTTTTSPSVANIGANSCGTSAASIAGTDNAWEITVGATAGTACRVTFDTTAPTTWECATWNKTTLTLNATPHQTAASATTVDITGTAFVAGDKLGGVCFAR